MRARDLERRARMGVMDGFSSRMYKYIRFKGEP